MMIPDNNTLAVFYDVVAQDAQRKRYRDLVREYSNRFGNPDTLRFFSAPGRTELGGNHTDHNHGKVLCAAVGCDTVAAVEARTDHWVQLKSSVFPQLFEIDLTRLDFKEEEKGTTDALIRGVAAGAKEKGFSVGGFNAVVYSDVGIGSGLSSSASFEVLVGKIFNTLYNGDGIAPVDLAKIGRYAENRYFGKPCGLMDQLACAVGGVLAIDFGDKENPAVEKIAVEFGDTGYELAVVDTGGSHEDLTAAYASIPGEMRRVASLFGKEVLREVGEETLRRSLRYVRENAGDRALLRAMHFFAENRRVSGMTAALKEKDVPAYLHLVAESGASSIGLLQNIFPPGAGGDSQPAALAIGASSIFFRKKGRGVCRIHGGGFAGTIQAYVHREDVDEYARYMAEMFGDACVQPLTVRIQGVAELK